MDYERAKALLETYNQSQLLAYFGELSEEERAILLNEIGNLNFNVIESLKNKDKRGVPQISPLPAVSLKDVESRRAEFESAGVKALREGKVAAVLLAGGQGTRLGFDKPKGLFNIGLTRVLPIFGQLINNIKEVTNAVGSCFYLFIMTSTKNNADTVKFFKDNGYFGYPEEKIRFFIQDTEPACGFDGKIFLDEKHRVSLSPNGNGGWYSSLVNAGLGKVLEEEGIEWLNVFGVDNVLQRICDPAFVGATLLSGCNCSAKVVKKTCPEERVGVLCAESGKPSIVEYYEMPKELAAKRDNDGELTFRYGVILNYLFRVRILNKTLSGKLPYHFAQKAIPHMENGVRVTPSQPNGYKFETLVVDMVKLMESCLAYEVDRNKEFAPVKNKSGADSVDTARALLKLNGVEL